MSTGISSLTGALVGASMVMTAAIVCGGAAGADPSQDEQFLALLEQEQIPAIDNVPLLVVRAHKICGELGRGTSFDAIVDEETNMAYLDNPSLHLVSGRVTATAVKFATASVVVYCPNYQGEVP